MVRAPASQSRAGDRSLTHCSLTAFPMASSLALGSLARLALLLPIACPLSRRRLLPHARDRSLTLAFGSIKLGSLTLGSLSLARSLARERSLTLAFSPGAAKEEVLRLCVHHTNNTRTRQWLSREARTRVPRGDPHHRPLKLAAGSPTHRRLPPPPPASCCHSRGWIRACAARSLAAAADLTAPPPPALTRRRLQLGLWQELSCGPGIRDQGPAWRGWGVV